MRVTFQVEAEFDREDVTGEPEEDQIEDHLHDAAKQAISSSYGVSPGFITIIVTGGEE